MKIEWDGNFIVDEEFWQEIIKLLTTCNYDLSKLRNIVINCSNSLNMPPFSSWDEETIYQQVRSIVYELRTKTAKGEITVLKQCLSSFVVEGKYSTDDLNTLLRNTHLRCMLKEKQPLANEQNFEYCIFSKDTAIAIIERFLRSFDKFEMELFQKDTHKSAGIDKNVWGAIRIKNEYDVQRILYAWLKPLFPTIRKEVFSDAGYVGMKSDLFLEDYKIIIEVKCTRDNMSEKKLIEELSSDAFNYSASTIYFYIYDRVNIIKNPEAFEQSFMRKSRDDLRIRAYVTCNRLQ